MPTNPNDPSVPSMLDGSDFPFRRVVLFCDECEEVEVEADVRADTQDQAFAGLRQIAADQGWAITPTLDVCPSCSRDVTSEEVAALRLANEGSGPVTVLQAGRRLTGHLTEQPTTEGPKIGPGAVDELFCGCCGGVVGQSASSDPEWCARCLPHISPGTAPPWDRTWFALHLTACPFQV